MNPIQVTALILTTAFYLIYLSKQLLLKRQGISSDRMAKGNKPARTRKVESFLLAITFTMPVLQYGSILWPKGWLTPLFQSVFFNTFGIILSIAGILYFLLAVIMMRDNWRAGIDNTQHTRLVTRGIYRFSRNPAFTGFDLFYVGIACLFSNIFLLLLTVIAIIVFHFQILEEEKYLSATFGEEYRVYQSKTRRY